MRVKLVPCTCVTSSLCMWNLLLAHVELVPLVHVELVLGACGTSSLYMCN